MERGKGSKRNEVGNGGGIGNFGEGTKKREGKMERKKGYLVRFKLLEGRRPIGVN